ncbi:lysocardiolipin acyltransferase 1-like [Euwallacea similis]|uniref:lysocardiolipin acyltransferase 1-like n=1 Tax=Euwallacea similis TaxID=1736056 RepID=UPI00344CCC6E
MSEIGKIIRGLVYFWSWNCSIFGGYLLFVPLTFQQILTPKFHRKILDLIITYWQYYVTTLLLRQNCEIHVTGDPIHSDETALVISNHRTRVDWNFLWGVMYHAVEGKNRWWYGTKFVLKNSIKNVPIAGWVMQMAMYSFIKRNWEEDKRLLDDYIEYVRDLEYKHLLILFPEGTDLTQKTKLASDKFAIANGLPQYKHVLHPRSTGFVYLVDEMRKKKCLDAVYDLTLIYPDVCPQNEEKLFLGNFPRKVMAHLVRYPIPVLPDTNEELKEFLEKRWLEKEKTIEEFKTSGNFLYHGKELAKKDFLTLPWAYFTHTLWMAFTFVMVLLLVFSKVFLYLVIMYTVGLYVLPLVSNANLFKVRKRVLEAIGCGGKFKNK